VNEAWSPLGEAAFADAVAAVVRSQPGVARLSGGKNGEVATYLPGRRVSGVRITDAAVEIHLVARWVPSLPDLADDLRAAIAPMAGNRLVGVFIEDVEIAVLEQYTTASETNGRDDTPWAKTLI